MCPLLQIIFLFRKCAVHFPALRKEEQAALWTAFVLPDSIESFTKLISS
jgi:hypothetical protein